jgi:hypothetical protein
MLALFFALASAAQLTWQFASPATELPAVSLTVGDFLLFSWTGTHDVSLLKRDV